MLGTQPDLQGIWQVMNTAAWDIQDHGAERYPGLPARFSVPAGPGVVDGNDLPYLPAALAKKQENFENRLTADPELKCFMPGIPRAMYQPFPFQIIQSAKGILMVFEFAEAVRTINMGKPTKSPGDTWMGWSNGRWEGDTLVIDVTSQNDQTWFDRVGDFHSDALHVVERYVPISSGVIQYEATITDPQTFSRPWKMSMPLYRHVEKNAQLLEFKCVEFAEELVYGNLRRKSEQ